MRPRPQRMAGMRMAGLGIARLRITWLAVLLAGPVAAPAGSATALAGPATAPAGPATALAEPAALGAPDPFLGEWVLDRSRSHYETELPMRMVIVMTATAQGVHYRSESTSPSGRVSASEYTADYDGQLAMVTSDVGMMAPVMLKRIDANTVEASYMRGLRVVATSRRVTSPDGNTMTITTTSHGGDGVNRTNVAVFTRSSIPPATFLHSGQG